MNIVEKYHLKVGDKITTDGNDNYADEDMFITGRIISISGDGIYVGNNERDGGRPPEIVDYLGYKYSWHINLSNNKCFIKKHNSNAKDLNK